MGLSLLVILMLFVVFALLNAAQALPFAPGDHYLCQAGPHQFTLQVDNQGERHVSRYALIRSEQITLPQYRYNRHLQWRVLRLDGSPQILLRFAPEQWLLQEAVLDRQGALLDTKIYSTHCRAS